MKKIQIHPLNQQKIPFILYIEKAALLGNTHNWLTAKCVTTTANHAIILLLFV